MPAQSLIFVGVSKDSGFISSDSKTCKDANILKVSRLVGLVPVVATLPLPLVLFMELEIVVLVATCLQRYL